MEEIQSNTEVLYLDRDQSHSFSVTDLNRRLEEMMKKSKELLPPLKEEKVELQSYCISLQEVETWLLEMSFPHMSLSCLQISDLFHREKHFKCQIPLEEIRDYKSTIDNCKNKGYILVDLYKEQFPMLQKQINQQLSNIQEGYDMVLLAAKHIQFSKCSAWLSTMESLVRSYMNPEISLLEKRTPFEEFQEHLKTMSNWQSEFDKLSVKGDLISNAHLDSRNSNSLMESSDNYNILIRMSEMLMHKLKHRFQKHQHQCKYEACNKLINVSLVHLMEHLHMTFNWRSEFDKPSVKNKFLRNTLSNCSDSDSIMQLSNNYSALLFLSEKVLHRLKHHFPEQQQLQCMYGECTRLFDVSQKHLKACCDAKVNSTDDMNTKLSNLKSLDSTLGQMRKAIQDMLELTKKVDNTDTKVIDCIEKAADSFRIKYEKLLINIAAVMLKITSQRLEANHQMYSSSESEISDQYETVIEIVNAHIVQLEVDISEKYRNLYANAGTWLRDALIKLQNLEKTVDSQEAAKLKVKEFSSLKKSLLDGERLIEECTTLCETISNNSGFLGKEQIVQETSDIKDAFSSIEKGVKDVETKLSHCLAVLTEFEDAYQETMKLFKAFESKCKPSFEIAPSYQDEINHLKLLKNAVNKLEKALLCHRKFSTAKGEFAQWLNEKQDSLNPNRTEDGNENALENKLRNIKIIEEALPTGKLLLNIACNSETEVVSGLQESQKTVMQEQIEQMKQDFSNLCDSTSFVLGRLSSTLTRLQEFVRNSSNFTEWIEDIEPKIKDTLVIDGDTVEIGKKLQYYKEIHENISLQQPKMNEMEKESEELVSIIGDQGHSLVLTDLRKRLTAAENAVNKLEKALLCHRKFATAKQEFAQWLNEKQDSLNTNRTEDGNEHALKNKLQNIKIIEKSLPTGEILLNIACNSETEVVSGLQESQKTVMQEQIEQMEQDFSNLCDSTSFVLGRLSSTLTRLQEFVRNSSNFTEWIEDIEPKIKDTLVIDGDTVEIEEKLQYYKEIHENISLQQPKMNEMEKESEELVSIIGDQGHSLVLTDLKKRLTAAENAVNKLEKALLCHRKFATAKQEFAQWLNEKQDSLNTNRTEDGNEHALKNKLQNIKIIEKSLPTGEILLNIACNSETEVVSGLQESQKTVMQEQIEQMEQDFSNLCDSTSFVLGRLSSTLTRLQEFVRNSSNFTEWIEDIEPKIKDTLVIDGDTVEIEEKLQYYKEIHENISLQQPKMNEMEKESEELVSIIGDQGHSLVLTDLRKRLTAAENAVNKREKALLCHRKFATAKQEFAQWLNEKQDSLNTNRTEDGNEHALKNKLQNIKIIEKSLPTGELLLNIAWNSETEVVSGLQESQKTVMQEQIEQMKQDFSNLCDSTSFVLGRLSSTLTRLQEFVRNISNFTEWIEDIEPKIKDTLVIDADTVEIEKKLQYYKEIHENISLQQPKMNEMEKESEELVSIIGDQGHSLGLTDLRKRLTAAQNAVNKREKALLCHRKFATAKQEFAQWLNEKQDSLNTNRTEDGNEHALKNKLQNIKIIEKSLPTGELLLNIAWNSETEVVSGLQESQKTVMQEQIEQMKQDFSNLCDSTSFVLGRLSSTLTRLQEFVRNSSNFTEWIEDIEPKIKDTLVIDADTVEIEKKLQYYKEIHENISLQQPKMNEMEKESEELVSIIGDQGHSLVLTDLRKRLTAAENAVNKLEKALLCHHKFSTAKNQFAQWLNEKQDSLNTNRTEDGNENALESKLRNIKIIQESLPNGKILLNTACDSEREVVSGLQESQKNVMQEQIEQMKQDFSNLCDSTSKVVGRLSSRLQEFAQNSSNFREWNEDIEPKVKDTPVIEGDTVEIEKKLKFDKVSPMHSELPCDEIKNFTSDQEVDHNIGQSRIKRYCNCVLRGARSSFSITALTLLLLLGATAIFLMSEEGWSFQLFSKFVII